MISSGLIIIGAYGTYQSYQAINRLEKRKQLIPVYQYQPHHDYHEYLQFRHLNEGNPFLLHIHPQEILPNEKKNLPIGMIKIFLPSLQFQFRNNRTERSRGHNGGVSFHSNGQETLAEIPITSTFGIQIKNEWIEAYIKAVNCHLYQENIVIPVTGFKMIFNKQESSEVTVIGNIPTMEEEYLKMTGEKITFTTLAAGKSSSSSLSLAAGNGNIMIQKTLFDTNIRGLFYYGRIERPIQQYQNRSVELEAEKNLHEGGGQKDALTKFFATHVSTDRQKLLDEVFQDERNFYELLLGSSIGAVICGAVLLLVDRK